MRIQLIAVTAIFAMACSIDPGPTLTASENIEAGKADSVRAEIHMNGGNLEVQGGASSLLNADFRFSERIGRPVVRYDVTGGHGLLTVESPRGGARSNGKNEWTLRMSSGVPLDLSVGLGAGESHLDVSHLALRSMDVNIGAGEMNLNIAGRYSKDVNVEINGGVGEARIRLPRDMGAVVEASGGIGGVTADDLTKREDGKYYNAAWSDDKPAVRMRVRGGVGDIHLSLGD
jgi:hypothetical protein